MPFPGRKQGKEQEPGTGGTDQGQDRWRRGGSTCGPNIQKDRRQVGVRGCILAAPVLGLLQIWPLPGFQELLVRSQQRECGKGQGGGKGVWTNWHIHDRCLLRKIQ